MKKPRPLPPTLAAGPFDRAALADADIAQSRLRRDDLSNPFHGVHTVRASAQILDRCADYAVRLRPGQLFTHVTAARLHGLPLPPKLEGRRALDVAAVHPATAPETREVIGHRLRRPPQLEYVDELPVCSPEETWCQLAALLDLVELVVIADHLLHRAAMAALETGDDPDGAAGTAAARLSDAIQAPGRWRREILRRALSLSRWRSASPGESRARVVLVLAGVPEPELNRTIIEEGVWLGRPDLSWPAHRLAVEYEGDVHRTSQEQWRRDIDRYDTFQSAGWRVIRITADTLRPERRAAFVARVTEALDARPADVGQSSGSSQR